MFLPTRRISKQAVLDVLPWLTDQVRAAVERGEKHERDEAEWRNMVLLGEDAANQFLRSVGVDDLTAKYVTAPLSSPEL